MPPKSAAFSRALSLLQNDAPFICASCRHRKSLSTFNGSEKSQLQRPSRRNPPYSRKASTIASVTAVNAKRDIPPAFQELHASLSALEHEAPAYVNLSQLKLALRGLESENAVTRVAVLGLPAQSGACRLVRALLADPLVPEPAWEKQVADNENRDGRALLLRYGEQLDYDQRHPLVKTLSISSPTLLNHNLEIIIQALRPGGNDDSASVDKYLVPLLEVPNSTGGRVSTLTYPVHKALVFREGFVDLVGFMPIVREGNLSEEAHVVAGVINGDWRFPPQKPEPEPDSEEAIKPVNVHLAEEAIQLFRQSLENSIEYEKAWFASGLPAIANWLLEGTIADPSTLQKSVRRLTGIILSNAEQAILREEQEKQQQRLHLTVPSPIRENLDLAIRSWAESAHTELRDQLDIAFHSKSWRKTTWWKLFWRVDDIGMIATDVLQRFWLVEAEKELLWLMGRIEQAGLLGPPEPHNLPPAELNPDDVPKFGALPLSPRMSDILPKTSDLSSSDTLIPAPTTPTSYPQSISLARSSLSQTTPPLTATAQRLLLTAISTTALTSSLSGLLYLSLLETSIYEAGGIAALGLVWSMRRLQKRWEETRGLWEADVREEGRRALRAVEEEMKEVVREGGREAGDVEGGEERQRARELVGRVREVLGEMR